MSVRFSMSLSRRISKARSDIVSLANARTEDLESLLIVDLVLPRKANAIAICSDISVTVVLEQSK